MQEKKNKRLVLLAILLVAAIGVSWWAGQEDERYRPDKNLFRDYEIELVDEVVLRSGKDTVKLKYTGSSWTVNGIYPADRDRIRVFFATLQQAEPKRPVASSSRDSISKVMTTDGVHVAAYINRELVQQFVVGGNSAKSETYFKKEETTEPFVMIIPGYRVYVGGIFELDESGWRDKYIFRLNWENFKSLETHFRNPLGDFVVNMEDHEVRIKDLPQADTSRLTQYMDYLSLLKVDDYVPTSAALDSLAKTPPLARFLITDIGGKEFSLQLFPKIGEGEVYALLTGSQWAVIQEDRIFPILRPKEFFAKR